MDVSFKYTDNIKRFGRQYDQAQKWLDNEVIKDTTPYVPMDTGTLYKSAILETKIGSGVVVWKTPYARAMYYGTTLNFRKDKHPNAQAQWFEASKAVNKEKWIRTTRKIAGGG